MNSLHLVVRLAVAGLCCHGLPGQAAWVQQKPANAPSARAAHGLAYDTARGLAIMFGGRKTVTLPPLYYDDTWVWNGTDWKAQKPTRRPPARHGHAMAYDATRRRVVLFGGNVRGSVNSFGDTWEWDGTNWTQRKPKTRPTARTSPGMAYDAARRRVVMFGGITGFFIGLNDTWEWDGTDWLRVTTASAPKARAGFAMAYDVVGKRMILFGGQGTTGTDLGDTWAYDGKNWTQLKPASAPSPRRFAAAAYDASRNRLMLFGGSDTNKFFDETWEWTGATWIRRQIGRSPTPRVEAAAAFDTKRERVLLFGGTALAPNRTIVHFDDTWQFSTTAPASNATFGAGCKGTAGTPNLRQTSPRRPWLGETLQLRLTGLPPQSLAALNWGFSKTSWNGVPLPLDLTGHGMPGCKLHVSPDTSGIPLSVANGEAIWTVRIPLAPILGGLQFFLQGYAADPGANAWGVVVSNGYGAQIGIR